MALCEDDAREAGSDKGAAGLNIFLYIYFYRSKYFTGATISTLSCKLIKSIYSELWLGLNLREASHTCFNVLHDKTSFLGTNITDTKHLNIYKQ